MVWRPCVLTGSAMRRATARPGPGNRCALPRTGDEGLSRCQLSTRLRCRQRGCFVVVREVVQVTLRQRSGDQVPGLKTRRWVGGACCMTQELAPPRGRRAGAAGRVVWGDQQWPPGAGRADTLVAIGPLGANLGARLGARVPGASGRPVTWPSLHSTPPTGALGFLPAAALPSTPGQGPHQH